MNGASEAPDSCALFVFDCALGSYPWQTLLPWGRQAMWPSFMGVGRDRSGQALEFPPPGASRSPLLLPV